MTIKKGLLLCLLAIGFSFNLFSQILEPVKWESSVKKISDTEYDLIFTVQIDNGWYIYSQESAGDFGPVPTSFEYKNQENNYNLIGKTSEPDVEPEFDKIFELDVKHFAKTAEFKQRIKVLKPSFKIR